MNMMAMEEDSFTPFTFVHSGLFDLFFSLILLIKLFIVVVCRISVISKYVNLTYQRVVQ